MLTTATAWAIKTETPTSYSITYTNTVNGKNFHITAGSSDTDSWTASVTGGNIYWKKGETHRLANAMFIHPDADVFYVSNSMRTTLNGSTTFTFTAPGNIAITSVVFKNGNSVVTGTEQSEPGSTYTVILPSSKYFTGFEVTYGYIYGSCGSKATWTLSKQNGQYTALTISGSGAMNDYGQTTVDGLYRTNAPWGWQDLTSVTIADGITTIGKYAFCGCQQLATATIGSSVTTLDEYAFNHCDALTEVTLPASVSSINEQCFRNSVNLQRVNIQRTDGDLITLGSKVFNGCNKLKYIVAPTLALAVQYRAATNWNASADKMSTEFCGYVFHATNEGGADAYAITSEADLRYLASVINDHSAGITNNKTFRQTKSITLSNDVFTPIGLNDSHYFSGTYDGGDYTISGLHIGHIGGISLFGLFGYVKNGTVKNVRLFRPSAITTAEEDLSPFIARGYNATVKNSVVINPTMKGNGNTYYYSNYYIGRGAIIGRNNSCTLQNLYFYGDDYNAVGLTDGGGSSTNVGRAHKVTIGSSIASVTPAVSNTDMANGFVYENERYYREGLELTLTNNLNTSTGRKITYKAAYKDGHTFLPGSTYTVNSTDGDVTLTAEYTYNVKFNGNGGTCGDGETSEQTLIYDVVQNLAANPFTRTGYTFAGWATSANGNVEYSDKASVKNLTTTGGGTVTLYAKWAINHYTVVFDGNGNTGGKMSNQSFTYGEAQNLTANAFTHTGFSFAGWATTADGDVVYRDQESVSNLTDTNGGTVTLYAKWGVPYIDADGNTQYCSNYTVLTNSTDIGNISAGWYLVAEDVSYNREFHCESGDIHLILCDNAKMTVELPYYSINYAINLREGKLYIYAQSMGSSMGQLVAISNNDSGIYGHGGLTICGGNITAKGGPDGIFINGDITIHSGQICASGYNNGLSYYNLTLGLRNATDYINSSSYYIPNHFTVKIANGQTLTDGTAAYSGTLTNEQIAAIAGKTLTPIDFATLNLSDDGNNAEAIREATVAGTLPRVHDVTLQGRTIYTDGDWNTLCLPFALSAAKIAASPLRGTTIMELDGTHSDLTDGTLTLNFNAATEMEAGRPYIVKWPLARVISTTGDWHDFTTDVAGGNTYENMVVRLAADIEVSEMVGTSENMFKGIFDGQGHTLQLNSLSISGEEACAPFRYVEGATIANLHTTGIVIADDNEASKFRSGLVGRSYGNTTIHNCWNSVTISSDLSGDGTHGGFIGVSDSGNATISNCLFDGSFVGSSTNSWGGFVGWSSNTTIISNSVFAPAEISIENTANATFSRNKLYNENCYYSQPLYDGSNAVTNSATAIGSRSAGDLAEALGSGWQVKGGKAVPVTATIGIVNPVFSGVTIDDTNRDVTFTGGSFKGTYASITYDDENPSILFLGTKNTLYWPKPTGDNKPTIGAQRAYFELDDPEAPVRQFVLRFGEEGEAQGITTTDYTDSTDKAGAWYTLDGMRLDGKPTKKGLYIHGGKKVVVP